MERWARSLRGAGRSRETVGLRRAHVAQLARALEGSPDDVTGEMLHAWLASKAWGRETRRAWRASLRSWWGFVGRDDLAALIPAVKPGTPMPRPTPDDALRQALAAADERVRLMLRLGALAGLRRGEIARVHADDLAEDLLGPVLMVHGKGDKLRVVPISHGLAAAIRLRAGGGWLFPGEDGGHLSPRWVGKLMARALPTGWSAHSLRHRFASRAHEASGDLVAVSRLLGHASVATTQRYVATDSARLRHVAALAA